jgi:hypothetical protein
VKEQYRGRWFFLLDRRASSSDHEGPGAADVRRLLGAGPPISLVTRAIRFLPTSLCTISLGCASTEATCMMVQIHWFQEQHPVVRSMIAFVVIATVLCLFLGPIGILYALGFEVLYLLTYLLTITLAALLGPDVY